MIGMLRGKIIAKTTSGILVDVHGVGYKVLVNSRLFSHLIVDQESVLYIHTLVREDALDLYGFETHEDLLLFELLISVSGVGPKSALGVFSVGSRSEIVNAIAQADVSFFTTVPRLGKKNGQKIIIELKNKIGGVEELNLGGIPSEEEDAMIALQAVGLTEREAYLGLQKVNKEGLETKDLVRLVLKEMGKK